MILASLWGGVGRDVTPAAAVPKDASGHDENRAGTPSAEAVRNSTGNDVDVERRSCRRRRRRCGRRR